MAHPFSSPQVLQIPVIRDPRGALAVIQDRDLDFEIRRVYFLYDVDSDSERGGHAHRSLTQLMIAASGSFRVDLEDGLGNVQQFEMRNPQEALYIPPGHWRRMHTFSHGSVCLVLASAEYDEGDYIRDLDEFRLWKVAT